MKSLIKYIANSNTGIMFRNLIGFKPVHLSIFHIKETTSVSDAFCWRTDNDFKTFFNYSDILDLYYKIKNSYVEILFFSKNNELIKRINFKSLKLSNKLIIDNKFLDGVNDYGVFYIFHRFNEDIEHKFVISNRCYSGFSYKNNINSFVHGNIYARYQNLKGENQKSDIVKTTIFTNQIYRIQNCFRGMSKSELFFANPTSTRINFTINQNKYTLNKGCSKIIDISNEEEVTVLSNCCFLRPIVFNYKGNFIDVYHG